MRSLRTKLKSLSPAVILASVLCGTISGQSALTTIQDTLFDADGTRYNGTLTIQWSTFDTTNPGTIVRQSRTVQVVNGNLLVQLTPNNTATPPANTYAVLYQSDGNQQYSETWTVPVSTTPLKVSQVRIGAGSSGGGAGGVAADTGPISESSVTNLISDLNARPIKGPGFGTNAVAVVNQNGQIETAVGQLGDCVFVDGTTGPCSTAVVPGFVDAETPGGTINGLNPTFTLANTPSGSSLLLFRNGILLQAGLDYTLSGSTIQFVSAAIPQPQDTLVAAYRMDTGGGSGGTATGPSGVPGMNGCGAAGVATKSLAYQIQSIDNGNLIVQTSANDLLLPMTIPPAGWCVVLLDTNTAGINVQNSGNTINGRNGPFALISASAASVVSDGSGYWISGTTGTAASTIDRVFGSTAVAGVARTDFTLPSTNACTPTSLSGTNTQTAVCTFAPGSQQFAFGHFPIPANPPALLYMEIKWRTADNDTGHSAVFNWSYGSSGATLDPVLTPAGTVTTAASATANGIQTSTIVLSSPAVSGGDELYFSLSRRGDTDTVNTGIDVVQVRIHN